MHHILRSSRTILSHKNEGGWGGIAHAGRCYTQYVPGSCVVSRVILLWEFLKMYVVTDTAPKKRVVSSHTWLVPGMYSYLVPDMYYIIRRWAVRRREEEINHNTNYNNSRPFPSKHAASACRRAWCGERHAAGDFVSGGHVFKPTPDGLNVYLSFEDIFQTKRFTRTNLPGPFRAPQGA